MEAVLGVIGGVLALGAVLSGVALIVWVASSAELKKQQLQQERELRERGFQHAERLKALEVGFALPDAELAFARAERIRAGVAAAIGIVVPVVAVGGAVAGTALVLSMAQPGLHLPVLCVLWPCCAGAAMVTAVTSLSTLKSRWRQTEGGRLGTAKFGDAPAGVSAGTINRITADVPGAKADVPPGASERITPLERTGTLS
jgi:hypothetical protein